MKKHQTFALVAMVFCIIAVVAWFLPFYSISFWGSSYSTSGFELVSEAIDDFDGEYQIICIVASVVFAVASLVCSIISVSNPKSGLAVIISGCICAITMLVGFSGITSLDYLSIGFWIALFAEIAAVVLSIFVFYYSSHSAVRTEQAPAIGRICPRCGRTIRDDVVFCPYCGHSFSVAPVTPPSPVPAPTPVPVAPPMPEPTPVPEPSYPADNEWHSAGDDDL